MRYFVLFLSSEALAYRLLKGIGMHYQLDIQFLGEESEDVPNLTHDIVTFEIRREPVR